MALIGLGSAHDWQWLVDDGWTRLVVTDPDDLPEGSDQPLDAVVLGPSRRFDPVLVDRVVGALSPGGAVLVLGGPHRRMVRELRCRGATTIRRYLAVPDAVTPNRLVPLDHPGGLAWLAGAEPALVAARIPARRRLLRAAMTRIGAVVPEPFGRVVVVASGLPAGVAGGPTPPCPGPLAAGLGPAASGGAVGVGPAASGGAEGRGDAIILTSGFDEGSRTVVLPLGGDGRPRAVTKVVARPAYRANADREHELLGRLAGQVSPPGLVPTPIGRIEGDTVAAVIETYAGRWTASAVLNEQGSLDERAAVLHEVGQRITDLARTGLRVEAWNADGFEMLIGRWFDEIDRMFGPSPDRLALRRVLSERSADLEGRGLPMGLRHFDLGPWNVVFADRVDGGGRSGGPGRSVEPASVVFVDWELAPPRTEPVGPVVADHLYFAKYWLHIVRGCRGLDDELSAFTFLGPSIDLGPAGSGSTAPTVSEPRVLARRVVAEAAQSLGLAPGFLPLIEAHIWAEATCATSHRRRDQGGRSAPDGGRPAHYLDTVAHHRTRLLGTWPL